MTLDEAIQHAEEVADKCALTDGNILCENDHRQLAEWLTDYKRLLEQEPCEDAISRQAVLDGLASIAKAKAKSDAQKSLMGRVMFFTERLPSVKPQEPKTGHWIRHTDASGNSWHTCPACGHVAYTLSRFCPDCGKRLETPS